MRWGSVFISHTRVMVLRFIPLASNNMTGDSAQLAFAQWACNSGRLRRRSQRCSMLSWIQLCIWVPHKSVNHKSTNSSIESCRAGIVRLLLLLRLAGFCYIVFGIREGYGWKPCFLPLRHTTSSMRSKSTFGILAAFQQRLLFNLWRARICLEHVFCLLCSWYSLVPRLYPAEYAMWSTGNI